VTAPAPNDKTLFLAWQDTAHSREWFPVGRLDVLAAPAAYRFRYTWGAERARNRAGFTPLLDFPKLDQVYESAELFPLFQNRVLSSSRQDFRDYLKALDLPVTAEPVEILAISGGTRVTDNFEVFPKLERGADGSFCCRFFLHGARHVSAAARDRITKLTPEEPLYVTLELTNLFDGVAIQIQTTDYHVIGWAPRFLKEDLLEAMVHAPSGYRAKVVRLNPLPVPSKQRLLVELSGHWPEREPMSGADFQPLVN
jgi:hypothetical protein